MGQSRDLYDFLILRQFTMILVQIGDDANVPVGPGGESGGAVQIRERTEPGELGRIPDRRGERIVIGYRSCNWKATWDCIGILF